MNTRLLRRVQKQILAEPDRFDMADFFTGDIVVSAEVTAYNQVMSVPKMEKGEFCGTTACIAGWVLIFSGRRVRNGQFIGKQAAKVLELPEDKEANTTVRLFNEKNWPPRLRAAFNRTKTARGKAKVAARAIDDFIATKGWKKK
jgi:hypothetical protein